LSLSTLPSSFTTLLLSLVDTPAYFNLTTSYLAKHFNPNTPDDPHVKYFSIAGRLQSVSVFHPFWFPKMVLDGVEVKERSRWKNELILTYGTDPAAERCEKPLWEEEWGNDGLVPVQSAKWGKFLGIMEGCDHWELRGARGITGDLPVDLMGDIWKVKDWRRFVSAFRKEEQGEYDSGLKNGGAPKEETKREREKLDADVKSSTDKLSAVFDWIVEQVPTAPKVQASTPSKKKPKDVVQNAKERRNELASKADLERFYVALSRKLYDEGL
jgi:triacylglycerol lipase